VTLSEWLIWASGRAARIGHMAMLPFLCSVFPTPCSTAFVRGYKLPSIGILHNVLCLCVAWVLEDSIGRSIARNVCLFAFDLDCHAPMKSKKDEKRGVDVAAEAGRTRNSAEAVLGVARVFPSCHALGLQ